MWFGLFHFTLRFPCVFFWVSYFLKNVFGLGSPLRFCFLWFRYLWFWISSGTLGFSCFLVVISLLVGRLLILVCLVLHVGFFWFWFLCFFFGVHWFWIVVGFGVFVGLTPVRIRKASKTQGPFSDPRR